MPNSSLCINLKHTCTSTNNNISYHTFRCENIITIEGVVVTHLSSKYCDNI